MFLTKSIGQGSMALACGMTLVGPLQIAGGQGIGARFEPPLHNGLVAAATSFEVFERSIRAGAGQLHIEPSDVVSLRLRLLGFTRDRTATRFRVLVTSIEREVGISTEQSVLEPAKTDEILPLGLKLPPHISKQFSDEKNDKGKSKDMPESGPSDSESAIMKAREKEEESAKGGD